MLLQCWRRFTTIENKEGIFEKRGDEFFVDLKEINRRQMEEEGVLNIDVCPYYTVCDNDLFFPTEKKTQQQTATVQF